MWLLLAPLLYSILGAVLWFAIPSALFSLMKSRIEPGAEVGFGMGLMACCSGGLIAGAIAGVYAALGGSPTECPVRYGLAAAALAPPAAILGWWGLAPSIMKGGRHRPPEVNEPWPCPGTIVSNDETNQSDPP